MFEKGDRVTFNAREFGPGYPLEGTPTVLHGTVKRAPWGRGPNVTIITDDGRTFCRLVIAVNPER